MYEIECIHVAANDEMQLRFPNRLIALSWRAERSDLLSSKLLFSRSIFVQ